MATAAEGRRALNVNVGVLGHVDSGKTSLVKALSTSLSTAALDKHPQSQQRGITLDLGFSAFTLPLPSHLHAASASYDTLQFTLVDCPGHASLIRTIIGGAQIIDMIILVVDANKGIQTQTAECIVIGEITTDSMVIALNKIDAIPEEERAERIDKVTKRIRRTLATSKFANAAIIPVSAAVGGERVAAVGGKDGTRALAASAAAVSVQSLGMDALVQLLQDTVTIPQRNADLPFYYAIDHCFPIKGHGSVLTGTVLSGSVSVNQVIEIPHLQLTRKVKSMQMFHKPVERAQQGDRVGICVTNLDAKLIERSVAAAPGSVPLLSAAVCLVKKVRFYRLGCKSHSKFHVTVGHATVVANVVFFGGDELRRAAALVAGGPAAVDAARVDSSMRALVQALQEAADRTGDRALSATYQRAFPMLAFPANADFLLQDEVLDTEGLAHASESVQWALLQFQQPVHCPMGSLVIGSKLDADTTDARGAGAQMCRLAFFGPIKAIVAVPGGPVSVSSSVTSATSPLPLLDLNVFSWRDKHCEVLATTDMRAGLCYEAIAWKLTSERGSLQAFLGKKVLTQSRAVGVVAAAYGADGQFRVKFACGARVRPGDTLVFRYKRYLFDKARPMVQAELDEEVPSDMPDEEEQASREAEASEKPVAQRRGGGARSRTAEELAVGGVEGASGGEVAAPTAAAQPAVTPPSTAQVVASAAAVPLGERREGMIESVKPDPESADFVVAVVVGAFRMEESVKSFVGASARGPAGEEGVLVAAFGKMGKCKVRFPVAGFSGREHSSVGIFATTA